MADGEVTIEVTLTKKQLEKGLKSLKGDFEKLRKNDCIDYLQQGLEKLGSFSTKSGKLLTMGLTVPLTALSTATLNYTSDMEQLETSFEVMTGSAEKAKEVMEQLKELGAKTPFETKDLATITQLLMNYGFTADDAIDKMRMLGDISQGSAEKMSRIAMAYGQMSSAGKVSLEDVKQMIEAGFNPLQEISESTGESMASLYDRISKGTISVDEITKSMERATSEGGKYYQSMDKQSETLAGQVSTLKDTFAEMASSILKSAIPAIKSLMSRVTKIIDKFNDMDEETKELILKIIEIGIAIGPVLTIIGKLGTGAGKTIKIIQNFATACSVVAGKTTATTTGIKNLSTVIGGLTSPVGIAITVIGALAAVIGTQLYNSYKKVQEGVDNFSNSMTNYANGFIEAEGYLDEFNETVFASSAEQENLKNQMSDIQAGITSICKTASDERREYTSKEIEQLNNYFAKMRELEEKEMQIQQEKGKVLVDMAKTQETQLQNTGASFSEYTQQSQEWMETIAEQAQIEKDTAYQAYISTIANLNARYSESERINNAEYENAKTAAWNIYQERVNAATQQVADVNSIFSQGINDRIQLDEEFTTKMEEAKNRQLELENQYNEKKKKIDEAWYLSDTAKWIAKNNLEQGYVINNKDIWSDLFKNMNQATTDQLSAWITMLAQDEMYGREIAAKDKEMIDTILEHFDELPDGAKSSIENAMRGMYNGMTEHQQGLFSKATSIANGIIKRMNEKFQIHSPSRVMKKMFQNVVRGGEKGFDAEEDNLYKQADNISGNVLKRFNLDNLNIGSIYRKMSNAVANETNRLSAKVSASALANTSFTANIQSQGNVYLDSTKVGKMIAPVVSKTFRQGGANA